MRLSILHCINHTKNTYGAELNGINMGILSAIALLAAVSAVLLQYNAFKSSYFRRSAAVVSTKKFLVSKFLRMAVTDSPPKIDSMSSGMFTNSSPETKRVIPTNMNGKTKFKVVYVVLESQYQSSLTKACNAINEGKEGVAVEAVGYLLEELRNPAVFEQFKADVADANIFIGSLIFVQELADKVLLSLLILVPILRLIYILPFCRLLK